MSHKQNNLKTYQMNKILINPKHFKIKTMIHKEFKKIWKIWMDKMMKRKKTRTRIFQSSQKNFKNLEVM